MKKYTIIVGHYGSGKTCFAANYALKNAQNSKSTAVIDLDTVNPYFRISDFKEIFSQSGIRLISPLYANTNLDIPALTFELRQIPEEKVIIDVGGDDSGAVVLARYSDFFREISDELECIYVMNMYRLGTESPDEAVEIMREIERSSGLTVHSAVNNSNLGEETTAEVIEKSAAYAEKFCEITGLPLKYTIDSCGDARVKNRFPAETYKLWKGALNGKNYY